MRWGRESHQIYLREGVSVFKEGLSLQPEGVSPKPWAPPLWDPATVCVGRCISASGGGGAPGGRGQLLS